MRRMKHDRTEPELNPTGHWTVWVRGDCAEAANNADGVRLNGFTNYKAYCIDGVTSIEVGYCCYSEAIERAMVFGDVIDLSSP